MMLRPLYYDMPEDISLCFRNRNQYLFGDCLMVSPITHPMDQETLLGETEVYLPGGTWTDFFTGARYHGGRRLKMFRALNTIPVLVKAGGILPMNGEEHLKNGAALPQEILLRLFPEADGETELIEDNGRLPADPAYRRVVTRLRRTRGDGLTGEIDPPEGDTSLLPTGRCFSVELYGVTDTLPDACDCCYTSVYDRKRRVLSIQPQAADCRMHWNEYPDASAPDRTDAVAGLLLQAEISYDLKASVLQQIRKYTDPLELMAELQTMPVPVPLIGAILEILTVF